MFFNVQVFQRLGFSGSRFSGSRFLGSGSRVRVQVIEVVVFDFFISSSNTSFKRLFRDIFDLLQNISRMKNSGIFFKEFSPSFASIVERM